MVRMDGFDDVEGLALVEKTSTGVRLVVTEEGRLNLVLITLPLMGAADGVVVEATVDYAAVPPEDMYAVSLVDDAKSTNRGLEGVAYDPAGFFYTLTEELPMRVLRARARQYFSSAARRVLPAARCSTRPPIRRAAFPPLLSLRPLVSLTVRPSSLLLPLFPSRPPPSLWPCLTPPPTHP